jgi:hypothetical protein
MLARTRHDPARRRGVVLILILAMLGLLALIGVTFATFSGQTQVAARNFAEAAKRPDVDSIIDFGIAQLINDTDNPVSALRGHSLKRDMYGDDAQNNGELPVLPNGLPIVMTNFGGTPPDFVIQTNIPFDSAAFPTLFGQRFADDPNTAVVEVPPSQYWFARLEIWNYTNTGVPVAQSSVDGNGNYAVAQTFQVIADTNNGGFHALTLSSADTRTPDLVLPSTTLGVNQRMHVKLDNRYRNAFNGPGMGAGGAFANFRVNGLLQGAGGVLGNPSAVGMDEDYDAVDLDNWFLAIQSADGSVIVPSFHRPSLLRFQRDALGNVELDDWTDTDNVNTADPLRYFKTRSRILRPRQVDHPRSGTTFAPLRPDASGQIKLDTDGDGVGDSGPGFDVDNDGDGKGDSIWVDLGAPVQKGSDGRSYKALYSFLVLGLNSKIPLNTAGNLQGREEAYDPTTSPVTIPGTPTYSHTSHLGTSPSEINPRYALQAPPSAGTQNDDAGVDVSLTQLRNLLAGTRPQQFGTTGTVLNEDSNTFTVGGVTIPMPNNVLDAVDQANFPGAGYDRSAVAPVAGRWGEKEGVPASTLVTDAMGNPILGVYNSIVGPGRSIFNDPAQPGVLNRIDGLDDDYSGLDFTAAGNPEDTNFTDAVGALQLPSERFRYFVTPFDVVGTGRLVGFNTLIPATDFFRGGFGPDRLGRVGYLNYFRPPGLLPGVTNVHDQTINRNNLYHGYESHRVPDGGNAAVMGAAPYNVDNGQGVDANGNLLPPTVPPTFDSTILSTSTPNPFDPTLPAPDQFPPNGWNYRGGSLALNDSNEMRLYGPSTLDEPFTATDLEWLYRRRDADSRSLSSRLAQLAPVSLTNPVDGEARGKLFSTDAWDLNTFAMGSNALIGQSYLDHRVNILATRDLGGGVQIPIQQVGLSVAFRDRRINLNYPLPAAAPAGLTLSTEPVRQKWIRETYEVLKRIVPPQSINTPEKLAQLSQFVVNIIDFRDPDAACTQFVNTDILVTPATATNPPVLTIRDVNTQPLTALPYDPANVAPAGFTYLTQYGMEYPPVAINEILAFSFKSKSATNTMMDTPRIFIELVNMLTRDGHRAPPAPFEDSSHLNLEALGWDMVIMEDNAQGRPDPFTGQIPSPPPAAAVWPIDLDPANQYLEALTVSGPRTGPGTHYYYVISNTSNNPGSETGAPNVESATIPRTFFPDSLSQPVPDRANPKYYWLYLRRPSDPNDLSSPKVVVDSFRFPYTEAGGDGQTVMGVDTVTRTPDRELYTLQRLQPYRGGQAVQVIPATTPTQLDLHYGLSEQTTPGPNPSGPGWHGRYGTVDITQEIRHTLGAGNNPVDELRGHGGGTGVDVAHRDSFPFHDRDFQSVAELLLVPGVSPGLFTKRFVEFPPDNDNDLTTEPDFNTYDDAAANPGNGFYDSDGYATPPLTRPPGGRTKYTTPGGVPRVRAERGQAFPKPEIYSPPLASPNLPQWYMPRVHPYLVDKFYYNGSPGANDDGWHQLLEFFEVPSSQVGAIGEVAYGNNADWLRKDLRPGQINLNLIIDEEVFFGLVDDPRLNLVAANAAGPVPQVVTQIDNAGAPTAGYAMADRGFTVLPPLVGASGNMKAAFADFLRLRHSGGNGTPTSNALYFGNPVVERPFRSLSYPDINYTIMRPAATVDLPAGTGTGMVAVAAGTRNTNPNMRYLGDPAASFLPQIPPRRLFQIPDYFGPGNSAWTPPYVDNLTTSNASLTPLGMTLTHPGLSDPRANLVATADYTASPPDLTKEGRLGSAPVVWPPADDATDPLLDLRQQPQFRIEWLSKLMNLTTVRTHQYAVWVTVGYFEVLNPGNPQLAGDINRFQGAVDELGPEIGAAQGRNVRHRAFFIIDRTRATGFNSQKPGDFRELIIHRRRIQ